MTQAEFYIPTHQGKSGRRHSSTAVLELERFLEELGGFTLHGVVQGSWTDPDAGEIIFSLLGGRFPRGPAEASGFPPGTCKDSLRAAEYLFQRRRKGGTPMKGNPHAYRTLEGKWIHFAALSREENRALAAIQRSYKQNLDWVQFTNFWRAKVRRLYRGAPPAERPSKAIYLIGQDLEARLGVSQKYFRSPDYRDQLTHLIAETYPSRYAFCRATGLDQGFLSRLLHKSTDVSVERLNRALRRIGWELRLARAVRRESKSRKVKTAVI